MHLAGRHGATVIRVRHKTIALVGLAIGLVGCKGDSPSSPLSQVARTCAHDSELECPRPIFTVRDLRASQSYYRDALGFKVDWEYGDPPDFTSVSRGHTTLFMCQGCPANVGSWLWVSTPNVDRLHEEFRRRKAIIKMPPTNMPWHAREMHVADPDGNVLRIASGIDD